MSLSLRLNPLFVSLHQNKNPLFSSPSKQTTLRTPLFKSINPLFNICTKPKFLNSRISVKCCKNEIFKHSAVVDDHKPKWENFLLTVASLHPICLYVGVLTALTIPSTFSWFVNRGPTSYNLTLGLTMLAMGMSLDLKDLFNLFMQRPLSILFGCAAQYTIMPAFAVIVIKVWELSPLPSAGLILLSCCPGGTAFSVGLIAQGDVPLSTVMRVCTTIGTVILTPLLCKILAGTYVPVDAVKLSISILQVVVGPILLGSYLRRTFPKAAKLVTPFAPLLAVLASSLLACSVLSDITIRFRSILGVASLLTYLLPNYFAQLMVLVLAVVTIIPVLLLHSAGFFVGYLSAAFSGFEEPQRRAISIEVGMQNSLLGMVLATSHFELPEIALFSAVSVVIMVIIGSILEAVWSG